MVIFSATSRLIEFILTAVVGLTFGRVKCALNDWHAFFFLVMC